MITGSDIVNPTNGSLSQTRFTETMPLNPHEISGPIPFAESVPFTGPQNSL